MDFKRFFLNLKKLKKKKEKKNCFLPLVRPHGQFRPGCGLRPAMVTAGRNIQEKSADNREACVWGVVFEIEKKKKKALKVYIL